MEKAPPLVIPADVVLDFAEDGITIQNRGDVVLHASLGKAFKSVTSTEGSVELHGDVQAGSLVAHGSVTVLGSVTAGRVESGQDVNVSGDASVAELRAGGSVQVDGGASVKGLHAGDAVQIAGGLAAEAVHAGGLVHVGGPFEGGLIRGAEIELGGNVTARGVQAERAVRVGPVKLQVDAIIAPEVTLDAKTGGRCSIIESNNELGANKIKGGFRLADWEETFGDPAEYLAERGLNAPGTAAPEVALPTATEPAPLPVTVQIEEPAAEPAAEAAAEPDPVEEPEPAEEPEAEPVEEAEADDPADAPAEAAEDEPADEPSPPSEATPVVAMDVEIEESEEASMNHSVPTLPPEHPLHGDLVNAVTRIIDCYGGNEVPPAVTHLSDLIETRSYDQIRAEITTIWTDLLKYHQKNGLRIQHQLTNTFNTINSLVKKM